MQRKNSDDALIEGLFEIRVTGMDLVEVQIPLPLFVHSLGDQAF